MRFNNSRFVWGFCLVVFVLSSFTNDNLQKKSIRNKDFDIYFYVSLRDKVTSKNKTYHWYKSGTIYSSFGDAGGALLHEKYIKYYAGNALAEKGDFYYGLKKGVWKKWHLNGLLKERVIWVQGVKNGPYYQYNDAGLLVLKGAFRNNKKHNV